MSDTDGYEEPEAPAPIEEPEPDTAAVKRRGRPRKEAAPEPDPVLSADEIEAIRAKARAHVEKEIKNKAVADLLAQFEAEERAARGLIPETGEPTPKELIEVRVNLPKYADCLRMDQKLFFHGVTYKVSPSLAVSMYDQMQHAWRQEDQTAGHWFGPGHRQRGTIVGKSGEIINGAGSFR